MLNATEESITKRKSKKYESRQFPKVVELNDDYKMI